MPRQPAPTAAWSRVTPPSSSTARPVASSSTAAWTARAHRKQHKKACKQRAAELKACRQRVAELKDEKLYIQGLERPEGDFCPICTLPISFWMGEHYSVIKVCCTKRICKGCTMAFEKRGITDCPFCRTPPPTNDAAVMAMFQARVAKKDPEAINFLARGEILPWKTWIAEGYAKGSQTMVRGC